MKENQIKEACNKKGERWGKKKLKKYLTFVIRPSFDSELAKCDFLKRKLKIKKGRKGT